MRAREFIKEDGDSTVSGAIAPVVMPMGTMIKRMPETAKYSQPYKKKDKRRVSR
jgi:hypothetical protein